MYWAVNTRRENREVNMTKNEYKDTEEKIKDDGEIRKKKYWLKVT